MVRPYAVKIVVRHEDGCTTTQNHVRPVNSRLSVETFESVALGRMLRMLSDWDDNRGLSVTGWTITQIDPTTA